MANYKEQKFKAGDEALTIDFPDYEILEHKIGNQTDADTNANKFFSIELHKASNGKFRVYTNYGRVDSNEYSGAVGIYGPMTTEFEAKDFFDSKWSDKSRKYKEIAFIKANKGSPKSRTKKYKVSEEEIPTDLKKIVESSTPAIKTFSLHSDVERLVEQFYKESSNAIKSNAAVEITSDGIQSPLGVLSFKTLDVGKTILGELGQAVKSNDKNEIKKLSSHFYSYIPTKLGRKIQDSDLISTDELIQNKLDLIEMMKSALDVGSHTFNSDVYNKYTELGADIQFVDKSDPEWLRVENKIKETKGNNHYNTTTKVKNICRLNVKADRSRYTSCLIDNEIELYHGSRNCNVMSIIKSGLKIAPKEAPRSGLAFGYGIYAANASTKSINYSLYPFPGVEKSKNCFLFLVKAKTGKQMEVQYGNGNEADICQSKGFHSVYAKAGRGLIHDEFIFPTVDQISITHIVELER